MLMLGCTWGVSSRCEYPAIYNFRDSNSATGGFGSRQPKPPNANNRICDGKIIIDLIGNKKIIFMFDIKLISFISF